MSKSAGPRCIFHTTFLQKEVDPRVQALWPTAKVPFGDLRRTWRLVHCSTVNPYGDSELCPYPASDCALAFLSVVQSATAASRNPMGFFRTLARSEGLRRLESKPLLRDQVRGEERPSSSTHRPVGLQQGPGSDDRGGVDEAEADLRRARRRPDAVGDVLRSLNLGPHQRPAPTGKASAE